MNLDPAIPDIVRHGGVLTRKHLQLVMPVDDLAVRIDDERAVEKTLGKLLTPDLGLRDHESIQAARQVTEKPGFRARDVDRQFVGHLGMRPIENLVGEALQRTFGNRHTAARAVRSP